MILIFLVAIISAKAVEVQGEDGVKSNVAALNKNEISRLYVESTSYVPFGFEAFGGKFLNSTRNNKPVKYSELVDENGAISVDKIRARYPKAGLFIILSIFSACMFFIMAPCFSLICILKQRNRFLSSSGDRYRTTALTLLIIGFTLFIAFAIIASISSSNLTTSMTLIVESIGSVYVGGLNFTTLAKNTFGDVLANMTGFAVEKINVFHNLTTSEMISNTQHNLLDLTNSLNSKFLLADDDIGNVADHILTISNGVIAIKSQVNDQVDSYNTIKTNLEDLQNNHTVNNVDYVLIDATPFQNLPTIDASPLDAFPTTLGYIAGLLNNTKGQFAKQAESLQTGMASKLKNAGITLNSKFTGFEILVEDGRDGVDEKLTSGYSSLLSKTEVIETQFAKYNQPFNKFNSGRQLSVGAFLACIFATIVLSLACIRVKQRRVAMSLSSCLFLLAGVSMTLSVLHYLFAFAMTEVCDQLQDGFPILTELNINPKFAKYADAGLTTVNMCSNGKKFDEILQSPEFDDFIGNFTDYLNITMQFDNLMSKYNLSEFTDALDFNIQDLIDIDKIDQVSATVNGLDFSDLSTTDSIRHIDTQPVQDVINTCTTVKSGINRYAFDYNPTSATDFEKDACVVDFDDRLQSSIDEMEMVNDNITQTNGEIDVLVNESTIVFDTTTELKYLMTNITELVDTGVTNFTNTIITGKQKILQKVAEMPPDILALVVDEYNTVRNSLTCALLGQTIKVMEYEICSRFR
eukprot:NODE_148_length_17471_cov_0.413136.p1 type:complete len:749 gc:universal NODE_148_length_17471_cov_0.413136:9122-6876(-)